MITTYLKNETHELMIQAGTGFRQSTCTTIMKIEIRAIGHIREAYIAEGITEYQKRLRPYTRFSIREFPVENLPEVMPLTQRRGRDQEGIRLLNGLSADTVIIALDPEGETWTSEDLARRMTSFALSGRNDLVFLIGGPPGLSDLILDRADICLSLSRMTFPHQLVRLILVEQLYRAFRIMRGEPYHK